jgi:hypothetical protein
MPNTRVGNRSESNLGRTLSLKAPAVCGLDIQLET